MIRVYKDERLICEQTETEMVTGLVELPDNKYAYSVSNGTIGVYEQDTRLWRVKVNLLHTTGFKRFLYLLGSGVNLSFWLF